MLVLTLILFSLLCGWRECCAVPTEKLSPRFSAVLQDTPRESLVTGIVLLNDEADVSGLDAQLRAQSATRQHRHQVIVDALRSTAEQSQKSLIEFLEAEKEAGRISHYKSYWITNVVLVRAKPSFFDALTDRADVRLIDVNVRPVLNEPPERATPRHGQSLDLNHGVPRGIRAVRARQVWYELNITGEGRLVGSLDTGVDASHPALSARWRGLSAPAAECWLDVISTSTMPSDLHGHGTHTTGTMCGNSSISNDSIGVAPNAKWIACNAIGQSAGNEIDSDILAGFQWFADPDHNSQTIEDVPDVINNSWGVGPWVGAYPDCYNYWDAAIINCEAAGTVVIFSAGNNGTASSLGSPATVAIDSVTHFAIGAVDATNDTIPPYQIASFSSRGPSSCAPDTAIKPEVSAPGVDVYSSMPGNSYSLMDGTSMAGPHVAGIIALMREANPNIDVREIKSILMRTAIDYAPAGHDNTFGAGFVDAYEAVLAVTANRGLIQGIVTSQQTGGILPGTRIGVIETNRWTTSDNDGHYYLSLIADSAWHLQFRYFGYLTQTFAVTLSEGDTTTLNVPMPTAPSGTINGVVLAGEVPIERATVQLPETPLGTIYTDSTGRFSVLIPSDTSYLLRVSYHDAVKDTLVRVNDGQILSLNIALSSPRMAPSAPDAFGYRAFDRYDTVYAPTFDWVEIAPSLGGPGTRISLPARDSSAYVGLPFPFVFYGLPNDSITINENGWIAPGISHDHSFFNFPLPGASGPSGILAVAWDNLIYSDDADICYWADSIGGRFIVEYYNVQFAPPGATRLTCQVQIFSTETRPATWNACEILYLYKRIDMPDLCTVGIESPTETVAVQTVYNGYYAASAWRIGPGAAIRFSTRAGAEYGSLNGQVTLHPAGDASSANLWIGGRILHPAANGLFTVDSLLTGTYHAVVTDAGYERAGATVTIENNAAANQSFEIWRLDPPRDLTALVQGSTVDLSWSSPIATHSAHLDAFNRYAVFRDGILIEETTDTFFANTAVPIGHYVYSVIAIYDGGASAASNSVDVDVVTAVENDVNGMPADFALLPCYPNPFNPSTNVRFDVPRTASVVVEVRDLLGRHVTNLAHSEMAAGRYSMPWDCRNCGSGIYWIVMQADGFTAVRKAILLR